MKLTREDIKKYGTKEEKEFLKEWIGPTPEPLWKIKKIKKRKFLQRKWIKHMMETEGLKYPDWNEEGARKEWKENWIKKFEEHKTNGCESCLEWDQIRK